MIIMNELSFEWDEEKNQLNRIKHGIDFFEAATAFLDENAILLPDDDHSSGEDRYLLLGFTHSANLLVVCHCLRRINSVICIISARKATRFEADTYNKMTGGHSF